MKKVKVWTLQIYEKVVNFENKELKTIENSVAKYISSQKKIRKERR